MKLISWNVNGIRACVTKGFIEYFNKEDADIFAIQESKLSEGQIELNFEGYFQYWNYAQKKGYSGTAIFTKIEPISVFYGLGKEEHDNEGRVITLEFDNFYFVTVYTPNSKSELERLDYRGIWDDEFRAFLKALETKKPVIVCGDLNVAHQDIDLTHPKSNHKSAGFTDEERGKFAELLAEGFIDSYRYLYPETKEAYTWWSYRAGARPKNVGWRIDYFCVSDILKSQIEDALIDSQIMGSDHCPVKLIIKSN